MVSSGEPPLKVSYNLSAFPLILAYSLTSGDLSNLGWVSAPSPTFWVSLYDSNYCGEFDASVWLFKYCTYVALTFTQQERGQLGVNSGTSYLKVMLKTYRILASLGECSQLFHARDPLPMWSVVYLPTDCMRQWCSSCLPFSPDQILDPHASFQSYCVYIRNLWVKK